MAEKAPKRAIATLIDHVDSQYGWELFDRALEFISEYLQCPDCKYDNGCKFNIYPGDRAGCKDFLRKKFTELPDSNNQAIIGLVMVAPPCR